MIWWCVCECGTRGEFAADSSPKEAIPRVADVFVKREHRQLFRKQRRLTDCQNTLFTILGKVLNRDVLIRIAQVTKTTEEEVLRYVMDYDTILNIFSPRLANGLQIIIRLTESKTNCTIPVEDVSIVYSWDGR